jgi:hypothetical protein
MLQRIPSHLSRNRFRLKFKCAWVRKAVRRIQPGGTYGPIHGDRNGYWEGPYASIQEAEAAQGTTGKTVRDQCGLCWR